MDTLLYESWAAGIDTVRWKLAGWPAPEIVSSGPGGTSALLSKGDDNFPSGVLSKGTFNTSQGLTLELLASFEFTGQHWQELEAAFVAPSDALLPVFVSRGLRR